MSAGEIPPIGRHPTPKSKGKKPETPKLKALPDVDPLDVFEVALSADAGTDSSEPGSLPHLISGMSSKQLGRLERLVRRVQRRVLKEKGNRDRESAACGWIMDIISQHRENSDRMELHLKLTIGEKLAGLSISPLEWTSNGRVKSLRVGDEQLSLRQFISNYLAQEREQIREAMDEGMLIRKRRRQRAENFIESVIRTHIT